ncbi:MAG: hypothetical protein JO344_17430 [Planctomycetaceae bacterium]|nr:hypothetical protein [Planctomycetaceae bacterium]
MLLIILAFWSAAAAARGGEPASETANNKTDPSAIEYGELYQMPPKSKLPSEEIAILTRWSISCRILKAG